MHRPEFLNGDASAAMSWPDRPLLLLLGDIGPGQYLNSLPMVSGTDTLRKIRWLVLNRPLSAGGLPGLRFRLETTSTLLGHPAYPRQCSVVTADAKKV